MIRFLILTLLSVYFISLNGQQVVYNLSAPREISLFSAGISFNLLGTIQSKNTSVLLLSDIERLKRTDLDILDRTATFNYSIGARKTSDKILIGSILLPTLTMLDPNQQNQWGEKGAMVLQTYILAIGTTYIVKSLVHRTRPFVYNENAPLSEKLKADARMSFFSGHTSFTAATSFYTATMLTANSQNQNISPYIWTGAAILPAVQGYLRWRAGKHFPTDIFIGYVVGAGIGYLIPKLHEGF
jgi:membrane-associated phospholipid phosphatase